MICIFKGFGHFCLITIHSSSLLVSLSKGWIKIILWISYICIVLHSLLQFFPILLWTKSQVCELALEKQPGARKPGQNHRPGVLMRLLQVFILGSQPVFRTRSHRVNQAKAQYPSQESEPRPWAEPRSSHRISTSEQAPELLLNPWSSLRPCVLWRHSLSTEWHSQR